MLFSLVAALSAAAFAYTLNRTRKAALLAGIGGLAVGLAIAPATGWAFAGFAVFLIALTTGSLVGHTAPVSQTDLVLSAMARQPGRRVLPERAQLRQHDQDGTTVFTAPAHDMRGNPLGLVYLVPTAPHVTGIAADEAAALRDAVRALRDTSTAASPRTSTLCKE